MGLLGSGIASEEEVAAAGCGSLSAEVAVMVAVQPALGGRGSAVAARASA